MKKFENIIIVTDLDGTFLDTSERVPERNREAVEYFKANGGRFTVATGRAALHVQRSIPDVAELVNFPAVTCNGACLYDFQTERAPVLYTLTYEDVCDIIEYVREHYPMAGIRAASPDYGFVTTPDDTQNFHVAHDMKKYDGMHILVAPTDKWKSEAIMKVVVRIDGELVVGAMNAMKEHFGDRFFIAQSWPTTIDIQSRGVNKGITLKKYVRENFGDGVTVYACGDYINDLELLEAADVAVCPSSAHEAVKAVSDLCLCSNNEGLIGDLVEYIENKNGTV